MRQQSHNKCVEASHSLLEKTCLYFEAVSNFSGGMKSCRFAVEAESMIVNLPLRYFKRYEYLLVQIKLHIFLIKRVRTQCYKF